MKLNRVTVVSFTLTLSATEIAYQRSFDQKSPQPKSYDLDSKDFFWAKNAVNPFPQVAEDIDVELNRYKQDAAEITRSTGVSDIGDVTQMYDLRGQLSVSLRDHAFSFFSGIYQAMPRI